MRRNSAELEELIARHRGLPVPAEYAAFFDCFNAGRYFEAHEVLETLWLRTPGQNYSFYKGLIQLAGAFVHVEKGRMQPAVALFKLARANLSAFPPRHEELEVGPVLDLIRDWVDRLTGVPQGRDETLRLTASARPRLAWWGDTCQSQSSKLGR